ncbi:Cro/CI family transcriptional regulator [Serratia marcescens]|uniref:Cro/CI family transcriptional regulator n=1 Tax=Serratia marcescens TaxID=615 RepID=UPI001F2CD274|nr:Cro/CI family transcriptional regulator [Serratia marcescens]
MPEELINHYGGKVKNVAKALGVSIARVYQWRSAGCIPHPRQCQIEVETGHELLSDFTTKRLASRNADQPGSVSK